MLGKNNLVNLFLRKYVSFQNKSCFEDALLALDRSAGYLYNPANMENDTSSLKQMGPPQRADTASTSLDNRTRNNSSFILAVCLLNSLHPKCVDIRINFPVV